MRPRLELSSLLPRDPPHPGSSQGLRQPQPARLGHMSHYGLKPELSVAAPPTSIDTADKDGVTRIGQQAHLGEHIYEIPLLYKAMHPSTVNGILIQRTPALRV